MRIKHIGLTLGIFLFCNNYINGQCTNCTNTVNNNINSSAIGIGTQALGQASFASGAYSIAEGDGSTSIGLRNLSSDIYTTTIGSFLKATESHAMVIGDGNGLGTELVNNNAYSLMIGFDSRFPTIFVGTSPSYDKTGKVGIGNITNTQLMEKLTVKADNGEDAAILVLPYSWGTIGSQTASIFLGNRSYGITSDFTNGLIFNSTCNYTFNDGYLKLGRDARVDYVLTCSDSEGTARWAEAQSSPWLHNSVNDIYYNLGNVGIGINNTFGYALAVNGKILTDEVTVRHPDEWYDFVLEDGYELLSLHDLELYIQENNHLPEIPSKEKVKNEGVPLGQLVGLLLKKVEELTLYTIQQQKLIEQQQQLINNLMIIVQK